MYLVLAHKSENCLSLSKLTQVNSSCDLAVLKSLCFLKLSVKASASSEQLFCIFVFFIFRRPRCQGVPVLINFVNFSDILLSDSASGKANISDAKSHYLRKPTPMSKIEILLVLIKRPQKYFQFFFT